MPYSHYTLLESTGPMYIYCHPNDSCAGAWLYAAPVAFNPALGETIPLSLVSKQPD